MKLRQAKKILFRKKNYFWRPRIMVYAYGLCEDHRIGKAIRRVRAYQKKGGKLMSKQEWFVLFIFLFTILMAILG